MRGNYSVREYEIALNMIPGIGRKRFRSLVGYFGNAKAVFESGIGDLSGVPDIGSVTAKTIREFDVAKNLDSELECLHKYNIHTLHLYDDDYPTLLKAIYDPPVLLYIQGHVEKNDKMPLAVIGTRMPTKYGSMATEKLVRELLPYNPVIISGLARGIDTIAHKTTLKGSGKTYAVLGSGLLNIYPPENRELAGRIIENGAIISEFNLFRKPDKMNFPARNRIVAAMSVGTLVVEAPEKSGALITAYFATDYGREVFAVPGPVNSPKGKGGNSLIRRGAKLVERVEDIIEELPGGDEMLKSMETNKSEKNEEGLSSEERAVFHHINEEPKHIDNIAEGAQMASPTVSAILMQLEMMEKVKNLGGHFYVRMF